MSNVKPDFAEFFREWKQATDALPDDMQVESQQAKGLVLASLALECDLKIYVEIGIGSGAGFLPVAYAAKLLNGKAYGINVHGAGIAREQTGNGRPAGQYDESPGNGGGPEMDKNIEKIQLELGLSQNSEIINDGPASAMEHLQNARIPIDMLHINDNQDAFNVHQTVDGYLPLVRDGGFLVLDGIHRDSVKSVFYRLKENYEVVLENGRFAILQRKAPSGEMPTRLKHRLGNLLSLLENIDPAFRHLPEESKPTTISVVVISYNQEKYIGECLEGVFAQRGDFKIELVIGDDNSTDRTPKIIQNYTDLFCSDKVTAKILPTDKNIGMTRNLQRCLNACTGDYTAVCEGDDYWFDCNKLQKQVSLLQLHPEYALCFHYVYLYFQDSGEFSTLEAHRNLGANSLSTRDIVSYYSIGNLSCCMYNACHMEKLPEGLFDLYIGDWMLNIYYSRFGDIGILKDFMSVYRKHSQGVWSGHSQTDQYVQLHAHMSEYNRFLNYEFDAVFSQKQRDIEAAYPERFDKKFRSKYMLIGLLKRFSPDFVIRMYHKLTRRL